MVLAFVPFVGLLRAHPSAVLAAIIIAAVFGLMRPRALLELRAFSQLQFGIALTTFLLTLVLTPRIHLAVLIGVGLAVIAHLRREQRFSVPHWIEGTGAPPPTSRGAVLRFCACAGEPAHRPAQRQLRWPTRVVLHFDSLGRVDVTGALQLRTLLDEATAGGLSVVLTDLTPPSRKIVHRVFDQPSRVRVHDPDWPA